jgi:hypothetical protein
MVQRVMPVTASGENVCGGRADRGGETVVPLNLVGGRGDEVVVVGRGDEVGGGFGGFSSRAIGDRAEKDLFQKSGM